MGIDISIFAPELWGDDFPKTFTAAMAGGIWVSETKRAPSGWGKTISNFVGSLKDMEKMFIGYF